MPQKRWHKDSFHVTAYGLRGRKTLNYRKTKQTERQARQAQGARKGGNPHVLVLFSYFNTASISAIHISVFFMLDLKSVLFLLFSGRPLLHVVLGEEMILCQENIKPTPRLWGGSISDAKYSCVQPWCVRIWAWSSLNYGASLAVHVLL